MSHAYYMRNNGVGTLTNSSQSRRGINWLKCQETRSVPMNSYPGTMPVGHKGIAQKSMSSKPIYKSKGTRGKPRVVVVEPVKVVTSRRKRSSSRRRAAKAEASGDIAPGIDQSDMVAPSRGDTTWSKSNSRIQRLLMGPAMTEEGEAFVRYHLDPAGYHETLGKKERMVYIPDGALSKGVGGEVRQIDMVSAPGVLPSAIPLDGSQWSLTIISFGTFRLNFIALASTTNEDATQEILGALAASINDFTYGPNESTFNYMVLHNNDGDVIPGWYWKPIFNKQTSALPEPVNGVSTTLDKWRIVGSSLTAMFNAATFVNQGYVGGGQFARAVQTQTLEESLENFRMMAVITAVNSGTNALITLSGPALGALLGSPLNNVQVPQVGSTPLTATQTIKYNGADFALADDIIQVSKTTGVGDVTVVLTNATDPTSVPITIPFALTGLATGMINPIYLQSSNFGGELNATRNVVVLPPITLADIMSNDPACEASILKRSTGVYGVHIKTGSPVYNFASATTFGPLNVTTPGYEQPLGGSGGGIRDTLDPNVGTIVMTFNGLATSSNIVVKRYFTWEGMPSEQSTVGQFAAVGGECDQTAMTFVDDFAGSNNCIYAARDNFLGAIAGVLKGLLGSVVAHQATPSVMSGIAGIAKDTLSNFLLSRR
nr:capsid protein [Nodaviridae sp.]